MTAVQARTPARLGQPSRGRRLVGPGVSALGATAFVLAVHVVDPNEPGSYPTCPWLLITGTWCPGCGTLRATRALSEGDVGTALARNPVTVIAFVAIAVGFANWTFRMWTGRPKKRLAPAWVLYGIFAAIVAFWVLRNVPGWTWLSPA